MFGNKNDKTDVILINGKYYEQQLAIIEHYMHILLLFSMCMFSLRCLLFGFISTSGTNKNKLLHY